MQRGGYTGIIVGGGDRQGETINREQGIHKVREQTGSKG